MTEQMQQHWQKKYPTADNINNSHSNSKIDGSYDDEPWRRVRSNTSSSSQGRRLANKINTLGPNSSNNIDDIISGLADETQKESNLTQQFPNDSITHNKDKRMKERRGPMSLREEERVFSRGRKNTVGRVALGGEVVISALDDNSPTNFFLDNNNSNDAASRGATDNSANTPLSSKTTPTTPPSFSFSPTSRCSNLLATFNINCLKSYLQMMCNSLSFSSAEVWVERGEGNYVAKEDNMFPTTGQHTPSNICPSNRRYEMVGCYSKKNRSDKNPNCSPDEEGSFSHMICQKVMNGGQIVWTTTDQKSGLQDQLQKSQNSGSIDGTNSDNHDDAKNNGDGDNDYDYIDNRRTCVGTPFCTVGTSTVVVLFFSPDHRDVSAEVIRVMRLFSDCIDRRENVWLGINKTDDGSPCAQTNSSQSSSNVFGDIFQDRARRATLDDRIAQTAKEIHMQSISFAALINACDEEFRINDIKGKDDFISPASEGALADLSVTKGSLNKLGKVEFSDQESKDLADYASTDILRDFRFSTDSLSLNDVVGGEEMNDLVGFGPRDYRNSFVGSWLGRTSFLTHGASGIFSVEDQSEIRRMNSLSPDNLSSVQECINGFLNASNFDAAEVWHMSGSDSGLKQAVCVVMDKELKEMSEQVSHGSTPFFVCFVPFFESCSCITNAIYLPLSNVDSVGHK